MTYIKIIFLLIFMLLDRCGVLSDRFRDKLPVGETKKEKSLDINGTWRFSGTGTTDSVSLKQTKPNQLRQSELLSFFPDSSFTELMLNGKYEIGKWKFKSADSSLLLVYKSKIANFKVLPRRDANGLRWINLSSQNENLAFGGFGRSMENYREDPFFQKNNLWRIKPLKPETKLQVRDRLTGYLAHSLFLMKAALSRRQQVISWEFSPGILKIYNAGIGVVNVDEIPQIWIDSFYSKEDALLAHAILKEYLLTTRYKGTASGNWLKDDCAILKTIYDGIMARKEKDLI